MNDYIQKWCDERHTAIDREFKSVWKRVDALQRLFWSVLIVLIANLAGIIAILVK